jgi:hypothetical protein
VKLLLLLLIMCACTSGSDNSVEDWEHNDLFIRRDYSSDDVKALEVHCKQEGIRLSESQKHVILTMCSHQRTGRYVRETAHYWHRARKRVASDGVDSERLLALAMSFAVATERCYPAR